MTASAVTHIPTRWDEAGKPYDATADDAAYGIFELEGGVVAQINSSWAVRVHRDELVEFQVDGTQGSAVAGLSKCVAQHRAHTPKPVWNPDLPATEHVPRPVAGGARQRRARQRLQGCSGRSSCATSSPGARTGTTCCRPRAACSWPSWACESRAEGRRVDVPEITL